MRGNGFHLWCRTILSQYKTILFPFKMTSAMVQNHFFLVQSDDCCGSECFRHSAVQDDFCLTQNYFVMGVLRNVLM